MSRRQDAGRVLVVEDEEHIREGLGDVLAYHGFDPRLVESGEEGLALGLGEAFDAVILDIMLPGLSGLDVCQRLRSERPGLPILMLTAKGAEDDIVRGLRAGADDYVTKPFSIRELMARLEALLRRAGKPATQEVFAFGPWQVEVEDLRARQGEASVDLSQREVELLAYFARRPGRVISRRTLLQDVWGMIHVEAIETRTVDVHVAKLRRKIDADSSLIETVRGVGYRARLGREA